MTDDRRIILILGDQLSHDLSSLQGARKGRDIIIMGELREEASYVRHHKKKIAFTFSAMRHFAEELRQNRYTVDYQQYDDDGAATSFSELLTRAGKKHQIDRIVVTEPGEHRLAKALRDWRDERDAKLEIRVDDRFFWPVMDFRRWAHTRKSLRMEDFYREMRRKTKILMEDDKPVGGRWNFDAENRKPAKDDLSFPAPPRFEPDDVTSDVLSLVEDRFSDHFGDLEPFWFAVTREGALQALDHFIDHGLARFGDYQDAMLRDQRFLYHSVLSQYLNAGLLNPREMCQKAEAAYRSGQAPLNAVEGFIRQILGWREYVRGIYWLDETKEYAKQNFFEASRALPDFYWSADTDMACIAASVRQTREEAYAHHIQRLMVLGNFALIAGIDPHQVHEWFLEVYADAYEWVEAPNVIGMSQFADGGMLGSKPYASSGAYINRMSDYCKECAYKVRERVSDKACPFNALYWDFMVRNRDKIGENHRLARVYQNWARMDDETQGALLGRANAILAKLDRGERV